MNRHKQSFICLEMPPMQRWWSNRFILLSFFCLFFFVCFCYIILYNCCVGGGVGWRKASTIVCGFLCLRSSVLSIQPYILVMVEMGRYLSCHTRAYKISWAKFLNTVSYTRVTVTIDLLQYGIVIVSTSYRSASRFTINMCNEAYELSSK